MKPIPRVAATGAPTSALAIDLQTAAAARPHALRRALYAARAAVRPWPAGALRHGLMLEGILEPRDFEIGVDGFDAN